MSSKRRLRRRASSRPKAYRSPPPRWVYRLRRGVLAVVLLLLVTTTWSIVGALRAPGDDAASVKLAEWARDHYLGPVVTLAENVQYKLDPPVTGAKPRSISTEWAISHRATVSESVSKAEWVTPWHPSSCPAATTSQASA